MNYEQRTMNHEVKNKPNFTLLSPESEILHISLSFLTYAAPFRIMTCESTGLKIIGTGNYGAYS